MPSLRIQFPEKAAPSTVNLDGPKVTIGRRADNTIQIVDRMVSAFHAELIREEDHYRLHDCGSTNGTRVNGEFITDFHLREPCKINFGLVECEFSPETVQNESVENLPTRVEVDAVRRENEILSTRLETVQKELESLRRVREAGTDEAGTNQLREELERTIRERTELHEAATNRDREFAALKTELARMNRDRQNLQDALSQVNAELANLRSGAAPAEEKPATTPTPEAAAPKPGSAGVSGLPKPTSVAGSQPAAPSAPAATPQPSTATRPTPVPRPAGTPAVPRPVARPAVAASANAPTPRVIAQPASAAAASSRSNAGPSGTQKISIPGESQSGAVEQAKPLPRPLPRPAAPPAGTSAPRAVPGKSMEAGTQE